MKKDMSDGKIVLINYSDQNFAKSRRLNSWTARYLAGVDEVIEYGPSDIDGNFFKANKHILTQKRGAGEWLWKPYFVLKTLQKLNDGDILIYCDSGAFFYRNVNKIIGSMSKDDVWVSDLPLIEKQWTKPYVISALEADYIDVTDTPQIQGGILCFRRSKISIDFVQKWLNYCCIPELLMPLCDHEQRGECIMHREDQSILSVLCKLDGVKPHRDPTQYGRIPEKYYVEGRLFKKPEHYDEYPVCVILHRTANADYNTIFRQWLCTWLPVRIVYSMSRVKKINN